MQEFLDIATSVPLVGLTGLLVLMSAYWVFVILGAVDLELFDFDLDFDLDLDADVPAWAGLAAALGLGAVPLSVVASFLVLVGWFLSYAATYYLSGALGGGALMGSLYVLAGLALALPITSAAMRPLKKLFKHVPTVAGDAVIGQVCIVTSGRVDDTFGQAKLDDGGAGLLLSVRSDPESRLARGDKALIIGYDEATNRYDIECYDQFGAEGPSEVEFDFEALERESDEHPQAAPHSKHA